MVTDTIAALKRIVEVGTRTETVRIGDAYSDTGWQTYEIVSEEAEIAAEALAALSAPVGDGELEGLIARLTWQPMDTAPKTAADFSTGAIEILAWCEDPTARNGGDTRVVWWEPQIDSGTWWCDADIAVNPSKWMLVPTEDIATLLRSLSARLAEAERERDAAEERAENSQSAEIAYAVRVAQAEPAVERLRADLSKSVSEADRLGWEIVGLKKELTDAIARAEKAERERDVHKRRGDNHWETLRGIRHIAREGGDLERIILWVNDAGRGYVETADKSLAQLADERNAAIAERDRLAGLVREAGDMLDGLREEFAALAEGRRSKYKSHNNICAYDNAAVLASRLKAEGGANG